MRNHTPLPEAESANVQELPATADTSPGNPVLSSSYQAKEVIVKFKTPEAIAAETGVAAASIDIEAMKLSLKSQLNATVMEETHALGIERWRIDGMSVEEAMAQFGDHGAIEYIEPNYIVQASTVIPNDPSYVDQWGLNNTGRLGGSADADIDAPEAWDIRTGSPDVLIGVIDSGVDYTHPDLDDNIWVNPGEIAGNGIDDDGNGFVDDVHGYDFANDDGDPFDDNGHGTHVAGTIAAEGNNGIGVTGVTWEAQIVPIKFLDASGSGSTFDAIQAIEYATAIGVDLTNNSWGGGGFSQALRDAIAAAGEAGQVFVAAAGNSALDTDNTPEYPAAYDLDNIISVAALDRTDQLADFSNFGEVSVDLGAPGVDIISTLPNNSYGFFSGTSMAAPHVAGVVSLLIAENPGLTPTEIKDRLLETVDPTPALQGTTVSGGRLNAFNALFAPEAGSLQGSKWHDLDADGIRDADEPGLTGWTLYLDDNSNGLLDAGERSTLTDADGNYAFNFLIPGSYTVAEVLQPGWQQTAPNDGVYTVSLAAEETITGLDFGNFLAGPAAITGRKWHDLNENGIQDAGESGLAGWTIYLDDNQNGRLDAGERSTITDSSGDYAFTELVPGAYTVAEVLQPGWRQTFPSATDLTGDLTAEGNDTLLTAQSVALVGGAPGVFTGQGVIGDNPAVFSVDDVDVVALELVAGDRLTLDIDADQFGSGLDSVLRLFDETGNQVTFSDDDAAPDEPFTFDSYLDYTVLTSGTYYVGISSYSNFNYNPQVPGSGVGGSTGNYSLEIILNDGGEAGVHSVNLTPDELATDLDFGNVQLPPGSISGRKWNDLDGDGTQDADEPGLANWTIYLDQNQNGQLDTGERSTLTDAAGNYTFADLPADEYVVAEIIPPTWQQTTPGIVSGQLIVDPEGDTFGFGPTQLDIASTTASVSGDSLILEMTFFSPIAAPSTGQLNGVVGFWELDLDQDEATGTPSRQSELAPPDQQGGPLGIEAYIDLGSEVFQPGLVNILDTSNDAILGSAAIAYDTDSLELVIPLSLLGDDGALNYGALIGTTTELTDAAPDSAFGTLGTVDSLDSGTTSITPLPTGTYQVDLAQGEDIQDVDFGNWQPIILSGRKWNDINGNGIQETDEPGLADWTLYLDSNQNGLLDLGEVSTVTDAAGHYSFTLQAGTYTVAEVLQPNWIQTAPSDGSYTVSLTPGDAVTTLDFGNQQVPGSLSGQTWEDADADGVFDPDEVGLPGWVIYLDQNQNGQLDANEQSTVTDANGQYSFSGLTQGTYTVAEVLQDSYQQTFPSLGSGFETGDFTGWETLGDARIETAAFGVAPTEGAFQALLTNSGIQPVTTAELETFLGLEIGRLDTLSNNLVFEGAAMRQTVTVSAGTELQFDWNFLTNEFPSTLFDDFGFVSITSDTAEVLADTNALLSPSTTLFTSETGYDTFSHTFTTAGTFTIGIGVVDVGDGSFDSGILIDQFTLRNNTVGGVNPYTIALAAGDAVTGLDFGNFQPPTPELNLSTLDGSNGFVINPIDASEFMGVSVSDAGDINGDGIADLIIGARSADANGNTSAGRSYVIFGDGAIATSGSLDLANLDGSNGFLINGAVAFDRAGQSVSGAGDLNNDGFDDLILSASGADQSYVVFGGSTVGSSGSVELANLASDAGFVIGDHFRGPVSSAGDVNDDGFADLIIGDPSADPDGETNAGASAVIFGSSTVGSSGSLGISELDGSNGFRLRGVAAGDSAGSAVTTAGDVNGDGITDVIIGAPAADASYVVFGGSDIGSSGSLDLTALDGSNGFVIQGTALAQLGSAVSDAGDINGDGFDDLIVGAPEAAPNGDSEAGASYVVFGGSTVGSSGSLDVTTLTGSTGFVVEGGAAGDAAGFAVSGAGDLNYDGFDDLILGAPDASPNEQLLAGESYVVFGSATVGNSGHLELATLTPETGIVLQGIDAGDRAGWSVSAAGDINDDGVDDVILGAPFAGISDAGESYVVFGVGQPNEVPVAVADTFSTTEVALLSGNVLADNGSGADSDEDGDALSVIEVNGVSAAIGSPTALPSGALVTLNSNGTFTYNPNGQFATLVNGESAFDTFAYTINDGAGGTDTAIATIEILGLGEPSQSVQPLFDYQQQLRFQNPGAVVPTESINGLSLAQLFDESDYLNQNPDVAAAVSGGFFTSGYEHFNLFGIQEGRDPSSLYEEDFYLQTNPDVAAAVTAGAFSSGLEHFLLFGHEEARDPSSQFNQGDYLTNHPDVAAAVTAGVFQSAFEHYLEFGLNEARLPALSLYNEAFYLETNPDVAAAVTAGAFSDGLEHFALFGQLEGRAPSTLYNEAFYLGGNPDVAAAVTAGAFASGFEHYEQFGRFEERIAI